MAFHGGIGTASRSMWTTISAYRTCLDDEWAPVILEGVRSIKIEDSAPEQAPTRRLDAATRHMLKSFYSFTDDDFEKVEGILGNTRQHPKLVPALVSGGVEQERAESLASWMLRSFPEAERVAGPSTSGSSFRSR